jgi:hypothetical protein
MHGRSKVHFLAKTLLDCSTKVPSSVRDSRGGIPAAGRAGAPARRARAAKLFLAPFYFPSGPGLTLLIPAAERTVRRIP